MNQVGISNKGQVQRPYRAGSWCVPLRLPSDSSPTPLRLKSEWHPFRSLEGIILLHLQNRTENHSTIQIMGRIEPTKNDTTTGKVGQEVHYVNSKGTRCVRAHVVPSNPRTGKQMVNRSRFALVSKSLAPLRKVIRQWNSGNDNAYCPLLGKAFHEAVEGEYPHFRFNYSKIQITRGALPPPLNAGVTYHPATREARFSWESPADILLHDGSPNDIVQIIAHHADRYAEVRTLHAGTRRSGSFTYLLPDHWKAEQTHYWLFLLSYDMQEQSDSLYLHETSG